MFDHAAPSTAAQIAQNSVFERLARAGCRERPTAPGHRLPRHPDRAGQRRRALTNPGPLAAVAAKPGGIVALWIAAVAFLVMALWRLVETALGRSTDPKAQGAGADLHQACADPGILCTGGLPGAPGEPERRVREREIDQRQSEGLRPIQHF